VNAVTLADPVEEVAALDHQASIQSECVKHFAHDQQVDPRRTAGLEPADCRLRRPGTVGELALRPARQPACVPDNRRDAVSRGVPVAEPDDALFHERVVAAWTYAVLTCR
jgi:hypothetical protein